MAKVMQFRLLPRPAYFTAVLGAQQRVAADDRTEFSANQMISKGEADQDAEEPHAHEPSSSRYRSSEERLPRSS